MSQIGIALIKQFETKQRWQDGFVILHHLHHYGIHYVRLSQPHSSLPPLTPPPTPCSVALMAGNMCLKVGQLTGALEVMRGCQWVKAANMHELAQRTELLTTLAEKCLQANLIKDAWNCLEAVDATSVLKKFIHLVTDLHNKILQKALEEKDIDFALKVHQRMQVSKLQCLPSNLSSLLQVLCDDQRRDLAVEICKAAISSGCYCPLSQGDLFKVTLPTSLVGVELQLLLERHLREVGVVLGSHDPRQLTIAFSAGEWMIHVCFIELCIYVL